MRDAMVRRLNWHEWYGPVATRPASDQLFLADAVHAIGSAICMPYHEETPIWAMLPDPLIEDLPSVDDAFVDGEPVGDVHARHGSAVRDVLAASRRHFSVLAPVDPTPRADADITAVSEEEWADAEIEAGLRALGPASRLALTAIADAITHLAHDARDPLPTYVRHRDGGFDLDVLDRKYWNTWCPVWRLASCGIRLDDPFNPEAEPTHHLFVDREGLAKRLPGFASRRQVALNDDGALAGDPIDGVAYPELHAATVVEMRRIILTDPLRRWRRPQLTEALSRTTLGMLSDSIVDAAREELLGEFPHLAIGGRG